MHQIFADLRSKNFSNITTVWKTVDHNVGISSCCVFSPLLGGHEEHMRNTWGIPQPMVAFNVVPQAAVTDVVASWFSDSAKYCGWITEEVRTKDGFERFINLCAFAESEDTCVRPSLWESLSESERKLAEIAIAPIHTRGPLVSMPSVVKFLIESFKRQFHAK